jgi:hypothetical protein
MDTDLISMNDDNDKNEHDATTSGSPFVFKVQYLNELRRIVTESSAARVLSLAELLSVCATRFALSSDDEPLFLTYVDSDNDVVTLGSDAELTLAVDEAVSQKSGLRCELKRRANAEVSNEVTMECRGGGNGGNGGGGRMFHMCCWGPTRSMARAVEQDDELVLMPDEQFVKSWLFANQTDVQWPKKVCVLHVGQQLFCAARKTLVEARAEPGETVSISLAMRAPAIAGEHVGYWRLAEHDSEAGFGERVRVRVTVLPREASTTTLSADEADEELLRKLAAMGLKDVVADKRGARAALRRNNFHVDRTIADLLGSSSSVSRSEQK